MKENINKNFILASYKLDISKMLGPRWVAYLIKVGTVCFH